MNKIFTCLIICSAFCSTSFGQIICIQCFHQTDSISTGVTNLIQNGSFELGNCGASGYFSPGSSYYSCDFTNWTCTGGGTSTYAHSVDNTWGVIPDGQYAVYMGNFYCNACPATLTDTSCCLSFSCDTPCIIKLGCTATGLPFGHPINQAAYGGPTGLSISQTVNGLTVGAYYVVEFWVGGEGGGTYMQHQGIFAIDVGFGDTLLVDNATGTSTVDPGIRYIVEFKANSTSHTIKFTNWGHVCYDCTEAILDDVKLYTLSQLSNTVTPCLVPLSASATQVNAVCNQCNGSATANAISGTSPYTYLWSNNKTTQIIDSLCAGTYTVTITDSTSLTATASVSISDSGSVGNVNITANKNIMCNGDSAVICADPGYVSYLWNDGDTARCITTMLPDNYAVTATGAGGCTDTSTSVTISIYPATPIGITVLGDTLTVNSSSSVQWYRNDTAIAGATSNIYITTTPGSYSVQTVDSNGCVVGSNPVIINGITNLTAYKVEVYPNPNVSGVWQLDVGATLVGNTVEIFNDEGRLLYQSEIRNQKSEIALNASGGIYMMQIKAAGTVIFRKLVKL